MKPTQPTVHFLQQERPPQKKKKKKERESEKHACCNKRVAPAYHNYRKAQATTKTQ